MPGSSCLENSVSIFIRPDHRAKRHSTEGRSQLHRWAQISLLLFLSDLCQSVSSVVHSIFFPISVSLVATGRSPVVDYDDWFYKFDDGQVL